MNRPVREGLWRDTGDGPRLLGSRCEDCAAVDFPARATCSQCGSASTTETELSDRGVVWTHTAVLRPPPGYDGPVPFGFGVVELPDDGIRVVTRLTEADPRRLATGAPVQLVIEDLRTDDAGDTVQTYAFAPAASAEGREPRSSGAGTLRRPRRGHSGPAPKAP